MNYITTAIDYPNATPHIGTAFEKIGADAFVRFKRFKGEKAYFVLGNDENTIKVVKAAKEVGLPVSEYASNLAEKFSEIWRSLDISYDDFIRTSEEHHIEGVKKFITTVHNAGFIEKRAYKSFYCEGCEEFKTQSNLENNRCPDHPSLELKMREEENYFFLLSKFQNEIDTFLQSGKLKPEFRNNEVIQLSKKLEDISISRVKTSENEGWGIPIPWDNTQIIYVWFDALLSYLTSAGFGVDESKFAKLWPAKHIIGKDITKFHGILFPAMIAAYNKGTEDKIDEVGSIFAHGFLLETIDGKIVKLSKTNKSVGVSELFELCPTTYKSDAVRYYFLSKCTYGGDSEFSLVHFKETYNSELANGLGNLVSRVHKMISQFFNGSLTLKSPHLFDKWLNSTSAENYEASMEGLEFKDAMEIVKDIVSAANKYIDDTKPWQLIKIVPEQCEHVLINLCASLRIISLLLKPFMPSASKKIYNSFNWNKKWELLDWNYVVKLAREDNLSDIDTIALLETEPLFMRITIK